MEREYTIDEIEDSLIEDKFIYKKDWTNPDYLAERDSLIREIKIAKLLDDKSMYNYIVEQWINRFEGKWYQLMPVPPEEY